MSHAMAYCQELKQREIILWTFLEYSNIVRERNASGNMWSVTEVLPFLLKSFSLSHTRHIEKIVTRVLPNVLSGLASPSPPTSLTHDNANEKTNAWRLDSVYHQFGRIKLMNN